MGRVALEGCRRQVVAMAGSLPSGPTSTTRSLSPPIFPSGDHGQTLRCRFPCRINRGVFTPFTPCFEFFHHLMATLHGEIGLTSGFLGFSFSFLWDGFNNGVQQTLAGMTILLFMGRISRYTLRSGFMFALSLSHTTATYSSLIFSY